MRVGIDSYSYHRLLGEIRAGEDPPGEAFTRGSIDVIDAARSLGVDGLSLETCFLPPPLAVDALALRRAAGEMEITIAWGHPHGLAFGADAAAAVDLAAWITAAPRLGARLVRLVAASPRFRGVAPVEEQIEATLPALAGACRLAEGLGLDLAIENHADLTAEEVARLIDRVGSPALGVCLDTANALRVGDDPVDAARALAPLVRQVHLKDVEASWTDPVAGPRSVPYGKGAVDVDGVLAALGAVSFDGLVCVELGHLGPGEVDERALVAHGVAWLRQRLARAV